MKLLPLMLIFILLSFPVLAEDSDAEFNMSGFVKDQGNNLSFAKILGAIVLAFLLISGILFYKKRKKK